MINVFFILFYSLLACSLKAVARLYKAIVTYEIKGITNLVNDSSVCVLTLFRPSHLAFSFSSAGLIPASCLFTSCPIAILPPVSSLFAQLHCCILSLHSSPDCIAASRLFILRLLLSISLMCSPIPPTLVYHSHVHSPVSIRSSANAFFPTTILKGVWRLIGSLASNALFICLLSSE